MASNSGSKTLMLFIGAVGFGIAAAILSVLYLQSREKAILASIKGEDQKMAAVVVANQDLSKGQKIQAGLFAVRNIPLTYIHPNAITPDKIESYYGRFLVENISRGKPLLTNFMNETFPVDFSDLIDQGRRAITIQVDEVQSIAGLTRPGNKIDVYVNIATQISGYRPEPKPGEAPGAMQQAAQQVAAGLGADVPPEVLAAVGGAVTQTPTDVIVPVLQDVRVLATGREAYDEHLDDLHYPQRRSEFNFTSMTVDVSPEQAALLSIAEDKGDLIAILRNRNDKHAAEFTGITPFDLISNAKEMKKQAAIRKAAEAAGATIDENGNWVTKDGTVIKKEDISVSANGTVTAQGQLLASNGITVNKDGQYVDANGNIIPPDQIVVNPDGTITTKDEIMKAAGYTINENGDYVDAQGNVIKKDDVKVLANGSVVSSDGKTLAGPKVRVTKDGFLIAEDGTVMTADGKVLTGVAVNENGEVVGPDGTVLKDPNLTVAADGTVRDSKGNVIAGVTGSDFIAADTGEPAGIPGLPDFVGLIIGGASKDGVAKTNALLVQPLAQGLTVPIQAPPPQQQ